MGEYRDRITEYYAKYYDCPFNYIHYEDLAPGRVYTGDHTECHLRHEELTFAALEDAVQELRDVAWKTERTDDRLSGLKARAFRLTTQLQRLLRRLDDDGV